MTEKHIDKLIGTDRAFSVSEGLTKREFFAGLALHGLMFQAVHINRDVSDQKIAESSVKIADVLLEELAKEQK